MKENLVEKYKIDEIKSLYIMKDEDIQEFAKSSALSYLDYPLFSYLTKGKCRADDIKTILKASIKAMENQVIGISINKDASGVALFAPPNYKGTSAIPFLFGGGIKLLFTVSPLIYLRLLRYEANSMRLKKKYTNHECWYLYNLTVKPEFQKKGMGSKLLRPMLKYLDRIGQDCYLETHKKENIKIYEHFGFELVEVNKIPKTEIKQYCMVRKSKK